MIKIISKTLLFLILALITYNIYDLHVKVNEVKDWMYIFTQIIFSS